LIVIWLINQVFLLVALRLTKYEELIG